jgi:Asp-tRNA(Asn)/Glu-tRNA(Gln) amidotransferase B subunit
MISIYDKILNRQNEMVQDYIDTARTMVDDEQQEATTFIDTLAISDDEKEVLHAKIELLHFVAKTALERLEGTETTCNTAMSKLFKRLSPEKQKGIIKGHLSGVMAQELEDLQSELLQDAPDALPMRVIEL